MTLALPIELHKAMRAGYQLAAGDGRQWAEQSEGPLNVSLGMSNVPDPVSLTLDLTVDETARFWRFWRDDTKRGVLWFSMPHPAMDRFPWLDNDGTPVLCADGTPALIAATWLCQFARGTAPRETIAGVKRRIAIQLAVFGP